MRPDPTPKIDARKTTIMVVDDDKEVRENLRRLLEPEGFLVLDLDNERRAIELSTKVTVDLLIADVRLPAMNARELANRITANYLKLKVVFFSEYSKEIVISHGMVPSGAEVIHKPILRKELLESVYAALASSTYWYQVANGSRYFTRIGGEPDSQGFQPS
jgi:two-component system CheB/CheR fusion protein